ncbi:MAG: hypothetical protein QME87_14090 [Bacillota bacterium]|nr:hypothetical protein [Bacillota bacterium]
MAGLAASQLVGPSRSRFLDSVPADPAALPSLSELTPGFNITSAPMRYEYAYSLAEFLNGFGPGALRKVIDSICDGATPEEALTAVTGLKPEEFRKAWHAWLQGSAAR